MWIGWKLCWEYLKSYEDASTRKDEGVDNLALLASSPEKETVVITKEAYDFLIGTGQMKGTCWGESPPKGEYAFWWRK